MKGVEIVFEEGKCPMLTSNVIEKYNLSNDFVKRFCDKGCSPICGKLLSEKLKKMGAKVVEM